MTRHLMWLILMGTLFVPGLVVGAVTEADFEATTTRHLLNLCTALSDDPRHREAIHFCHGYLVGAFDYYEAETSGRGSEPFVCLPDPAPTRNQAITMFIDWAKAHPQYMNEAPVETEFRFLLERWPCTK